MSSRLAKPSSYMRTAPIRYGVSRKLTIKPDRSFVSIGCLPSFTAKSFAASTVSSLVSRARTISTNFITGTGEKKCRPSTREGSPTAPPSRAIGIEDVFEARIVSGPTISSSSLMIEILSSGFSGTASITRSLAATSLSSLVNVMLANAASRLPESTFPRLTALSRDFCSLERAASMNSGNSRTTTGNPAIDADSAIPAPMSPPPRMATDRIARVIAASVSIVPERFNCRRQRGGVGNQIDVPARVQMQGRMGQQFRHDFRIDHRDNRIIEARDDQRFLSDQRQCKETGPDGAREQLMQVAHPRTRHQLAVEQLLDYQWVVPDGAAVQLTGDRGRVFVIQEAAGRQHLRQHPRATRDHETPGTGRDEDQSPTAPRVLERKLLSKRATPRQTEDVDALVGESQLLQKTSEDCRKIRKPIR